MTELTIDQALQQGVEAHKAGQMQEADRLYTAILKAQPKHPDANHNMGVLVVGVGKVEQALPFFKTALEANPAKAQFWLSYIDTVIKLGKLADAKAVLDQAKSKGAKGDGFDKLEQRLNELNKEYASDDTLNETLETNQSSTLDIAIQLRDSGEFNQAIDLLKDEKNQFPETADILALLSHCYLLADQVQEAKVHLEKATTIAPDNASVGWNTARLALKEQKLSEALNIATDTSQRFPDDVEGMGVLGACLRANGEADESLKVLNKAIELNPDYAEALVNRGLIRLSKENKPEAVADLELAHRLKPHIRQIWDLVVGLKVEAQEYSDAIPLLINMITIDPNWEKGFSLLAVCNQKADDSALAVKSFEKVLEVKPGSAAMHVNLGIALTKQGETKTAIDNFKKALAIKPDHAEAYNNMGVTLHDQGKLEEAVEAYNKALAIKPEYAAAYNHMGVTLHGQGKLKEAVEAYNKALAIKPDYAKAYSNIGISLHGQGKLEEAIEAYKKALAIEPDDAEARENFSFALLNANQLFEGFEEFEWRWKTEEKFKSQRGFSQPLWDGKTSLKGKRILLWCEQGVGDTINWSSCLHMVASQAHRCILECQKKLVPLLARSFPNVEVKPENRSSDSQRDDFDFHLPMGSLYRYFISEISGHTKPDPFLIPDPARIKFWQKRLRSLGNGPYIGVSWKSANMSPMRLPNYAPLSEWAPVFKLPDVTFVNLQYVDFFDDLTAVKNDLGVTIHNFDDLDHYDDITDVAALCAALDMVVSTKITVPLISAGVGTLTKLANWRQSPWSNVLFNPVGPSIDIFERNTGECWSDVFRLIAGDISKLKDDSSGL